MTTSSNSQSQLECLKPTGQKINSAKEKEIAKGEWGIHSELKGRVKALLIFPKKKRDKCDLSSRCLVTNV